MMRDLVKSGIGGGVNHPTTLFLDAAGWLLTADC